MLEFLHEVVLDALKDSVLVLVVVLLFNIVLSFFEGKLANKLEKQNRISPLLGATVGLIPQCGFSVVAADMYIDKKISIGTLIAVFIACSDEALPMMLANPDKVLAVIPLLLVKLIVGFSVGYLVDFLIARKQQIEFIKTGKKSVHHGCCHHEIEEGENSSFIKEHILHPVLHSLKIFAYVFLINLLFTAIIFFVGENSIHNFLTANKYLTPLFSVLVGLIPNCASSVIITELFLQNSITFGAAIAGLICNAGLGLVFLLKNKKEFKNTLFIIGILLATGLIVGYVSLLIGF